MNKKLLLVAFLAILCFSACQKEKVSTITIQGKVENAYAESSSIKVSIKGNGVNRSTVAQSDGSYYFDNLPMQQDYQISVNQEDTQPATNTTFNIVLLNKYILGDLAALSVEQLVSADIDNSNTLDNADVNLLRKAILGSAIAIPDYGFYRFITPNFTFGTDKVNVFNLKNVQQDTNVPTFKAVKIAAF